MLISGPAAPRFKRIVTGRHVILRYNNTKKVLVPKINCRYIDPSLCLGEAHGEKGDCQAYAGAQWGAVGIKERTPCVLPHCFRPPCMSLRVNHHIPTHFPIGETSLQQAHAANGMHRQCYIQESKRCVRVAVPPVCTKQQTGLQP